MAPPPRHLLCSLVIPLALVATGRSAHAGDPPTVASATPRDRVDDTIGTVDLPDPSDHVDAIDTDRWGQLERAALRRALVARGLTLDAHPEGKRIGRIHIVALDVFEPGGWMHAFDKLHATTRSSTIAASLTVTPGDTWDDDLVAEDARRLRQPKLHCVVVLAPVVGAEPGTVDVLVVTRDAWSLRPNTRYEIQDGKLTYFTVSVAENNIFGTRTHAAMVLELDQGALALGPELDSPQLGGTRLSLHGKARAMLARDDGSLEGYDTSVAVERPLFSDATRWAAAASVSARELVTRVYQGGALRTYDDPETTAVERMPWSFRAGGLDARAQVTRSLGDSPRHDAALGWQAAITRSALLDDPNLSPAVADAFRRDVLPIAERVSMPFAGYRMRPTRWQTVRNLASFDVAEDVRIGPWLEAEVGPALTSLGSSAGFWRIRGRGGWTRVVGDDGVLELEARSDTRHQAGHWVDTEVGLAGRLASPRSPLGRLVARVEMAALHGDHHNRDFAVGGDHGLRGFEIGAFWGDDLILAGVELRSAPLAIGPSRWGIIAFAECGGAGDGLAATRLHDDVGLGLRILIPQLGTELMRFDWAIPLDQDRGPGRFTAGVNHTF